MDHAGCGIGGYGERPARPRHLSTFAGVARTSQRWRGLEACLHSRVGADRPFSPLKLPHRALWNRWFSAGTPSNYGRFAIMMRQPERQINDKGTQQPDEPLGRPGHLNRRRQCVCRYRIHASQGSGTHLQEQLDSRHQGHHRAAQTDAARSGPPLRHRSTDAFQSVPWPHGERHYRPACELAQRAWMGRRDRRQTIHAIAPPRSPARDRSRIRRRAVSG